MVNYGPRTASVAMELGLHLYAIVTDRLKAKAHCFRQAKRVMPAKAGVVFQPGAA